MFFSWSSHTAPFIAGLLGQEAAEDWGAAPYDWCNVQRYLSKLAHLQDLPVHILPLFWFNSSWQATWISSPLAVIVLQLKHRLTACTEFAALLPGKFPAMPWGMRWVKAKEMKFLWETMITLQQEKKNKKAIALPPRTLCSPSWVGIIQINFISMGKTQAGKALIWASRTPQD